MHDQSQIQPYLCKDSNQHSIDVDNQLSFFVYYPYICLVVFVIGSALRYDRDQYSWKADSSQLLRKKGIRIGNNLFHVGIILLLFGHLFGLLTPQEVYHHFMEAGTKQMIAMVAGGIFGILCFIGMTILLVRRLFDPRIRATSKPSDIMILLVARIRGSNSLRTRSMVMPIKQSIPKIPPATIAIICLVPASIK
jgi:respiratory nitrate reductase gamma subunit